MTRNFHRWEVDPFFSAAEEVQDSADRLESVYRTWIHTKSVTDDTSAIEFQRRELNTALGTAKWQLDEFERAVSFVMTDDGDCAGDDAPARHKQFVDALQNQIRSIEMALIKSNNSSDLRAHPLVNLGEKEKDDLALFLCGSKRPSLHSDFKEPGFYISPASNVGNADDPLEGKDGMPHSFSTSALNSDSELRKTCISKSDVDYWAHELNGSDKLLPSLHGSNIANLSEVRVDEISKPVSDPTSEYFYSDRGENFGERANGHQRSASVGSGLNAWKSGSTNDVRSKRHKNLFVQIPTSRLSFWSFFAKARQPRSWRSGLKRWKDGDANASDSKMLGLIQGVSDIEKGNGTLWFGGSSNCLSSNAAGSCASEERKHHMALVEGFQIWQRPPYALPSSRPVQIASAILVALGLVGLLSLHVTSTAL